MDKRSRLEERMRKKTEKEQEGGKKGLRLV